MTVDSIKAISRPLGVAQSLVDHPIDETSVYSKVVVLTGEREVLLSSNGRWCFLDALALLSRVVGNLSVVLPEDLPNLADEVHSYCAEAWSRGSIRVVTNGDSTLLDSAHAILSIGTRPMSALPWTVVNSNGWVARVSSRDEPLPGDVDQSNAMAALLAASLGVTEVFKRVFDIPDDVAPLLESTEFSLFEQTAAPSSLGPPIPDEIRVPDTLMVGGGAIGNGLALLASRLPLLGRFHIVDKQDYADENLGTCILLEPKKWLGQPKAEQLAAWLQQHSNLTVTGEKAPIEVASSGAQVSSLSIDLILNALDDAEARRDAQSLWPATIIDGGINEIGAAVVQYRLDHKQHACLKCWFEPAKVDERNMQSQLTGLNINSLSDMGRPITSEDIALAPEDKRAWLQERLREGKTLCSIISEAVLARTLGVEVEDGFRPSAPFVATAAAALVMSEAIKALVFPAHPIVPMFQIANLFLGPAESAMALSMSPSASCQCVVHHSTIERLSKSRRKQARGIATVPA